MSWESSTAFKQCIKKWLSQNIVKAEFGLVEDFNPLTPPWMANQAGQGPIFEKSVLHLSVYLSLVFQQKYYDIPAENFHRLQESHQKSI